MAYMLIPDPTEINVVGPQSTLNISVPFEPELTELVLVTPLGVTHVEYEHVETIELELVSGYERTIIDVDVIAASNTGNALHETTIFAQVSDPQAEFVALVDGPSIFSADVAIDAGETYELPWSGVFNTGTLYYPPLVWTGQTRQISSQIADTYFDSPLLVDLTALEELSYGSDVVLSAGAVRTASGTMLSGNASITINAPTNTDWLYRRYNRMSVELTFGDLSSVSEGVVMGIAWSAQGSGNVDAYKHGSSIIISCNHGLYVLVSAGAIQNKRIKIDTWCFLTSITNSIWGNYVTAIRVTDMTSGAVIGESVINRSDLIANPVPLAWTGQVKLGAASGVPTAFPATYHSVSKFASRVSPWSAENYWTPGGVIPLGPVPLTDDPLASANVFSVQGHASAWQAADPVDASWTQDAHAVVLTLQALQHTSTIDASWTNDDLRVHYQLHVDTVDDFYMWPHAGSVGAQAAFLDAVVVDGASIIAAQKAFNSEASTTGWRGSQFGTANVMAGKPVFDGPYGASWNTHVANVMKDDSLNYITGTYVQSWGLANASINVAGLDCVKFCRAVRVNDVAGKQWKLVLPTNQTYSVASSGLRQSRNPGNDWTESNSLGTLDINANTMFGPGGMFDALCPNVGDGVWLAIRPQPTNTGTTIAPQVCVLAYCQDVPGLHDRASNTQTCSSNTQDLWVSTSSASTEYNARDIDIDFSMTIKDQASFKTNDEFKKLLSTAAIKLRVDNFQHKWINSGSGINVKFYSGSMPSSGQPEGMLIGTVNGLKTTDFGSADSSGMIRLTSLKRVSMVNPGIITYAKIEGTSSSGDLPAMWVPVSSQMMTDHVTLSTTHAMTLEHAVYVTGLAFRFRIAA